MARSDALSLALAILFAVAATPAAAQCILANPSFEMTGQGGQVFGGWNQFGPVGSTGQADHGQLAARVTGPDQGGWDVAAFWQPLDTEPGEPWEVSVQVAHLASAPLAGQSRAIVNVEWHGAGGGLISYESHDVADATTPADQYQTVTFTTEPAPAGTAFLHLLVGVLQAPGDPVPTVLYDQVTCDSQQPPTIDDLQWNDFPGGRTLDFAGRTWRVKGPGYYGPGYNLFGDDEANVWVDAQGRLHLTCQQIGNDWYATEVALEDPLGYGDYVFTTQGPLHELDPNVVFGLFLWQYGPCYDPAYLYWNPYNEIDVEFSRWAYPGNEIAQFVAQPFDYPGNLERFDTTFGQQEITSHAFRWLPDRVEYRSWRGGPQDEAAATMIHAWTYAGPHVPRPEQPRVHLNLWRIDQPPATDQEAIIADFTFVPADGPTPVSDPPYATPAAHLAPAQPNPFNPQTTLRYALAEPGRVELAIWDLAGRRVRTLVAGDRPAGEHAVVWNGRDDAGQALPSGVYLCQLRAGSTVEARRLTLVR